MVQQLEQMFTCNSCNFPLIFPCNAWFENDLADMELLWFDNVVFIDRFGAVFQDVIGKYEHIFTY